MVEYETSASIWYADFAFVKELAIRIVGNAIWGPVKAVFVIAISWAEPDWRGAEELVSRDAIIGVNDEEEVGSFGRILIEFREKLNVDFSAITFVLSVVSGSCHEHNRRLQELTKKKAPHVPSWGVYLIPARKLPYFISRRTVASSPLLTLPPRGSPALTRSSRPGSPPLTPVVPTSPGRGFVMTFSKVMFLPQGAVPTAGILHT